MKKGLTIGAIILLLAVAVGGQLALRSTLPNVTPAATEGALAFLGGVRSLAAEVVWFRADCLQEEGRYVELAQLATLLARLEPHTPEVWSYAAWNLAYNISVMMPSPEDRWRWVSAAIVLLRDEGLRLNPTSAELHRELAWLFELKLGIDIDSAAEVYRARWREIVEDVARREAWAELGMDRAMMDEVAASTGLSDFADPLFSAVYWAFRGVPFATGHDQAVLFSVIQQSGQIAARRKQGVEKIR